MKAAAIGPVALAVLLVGVPVLLAALRTWRTSVVVRFAAAGAVVAQLLYLRLPLKVVHLMPVVVFVALLAAASPRARARWLAALVAAQLLLAVVSVTVALLRQLTVCPPEVTRSSKLHTRWHVPVMSITKFGVPEVGSSKKPKEHSSNHWKVTGVPSGSNEAVPSTGTGVDGPLHSAA